MPNIHREVKKRIRDLGHPRRANANIIESARAAFFGVKDSRNLTLGYQSCSVTAMSHLILMDKRKTCIRITRSNDKDIRKKMVSSAILYNNI